MNQNVLMMRALANVLKRRGGLRSGRSTKNTEEGQRVSFDLPAPQVSFKADAPIVNVETTAIANALAPVVEVMNATLNVLRQQGEVLSQLLAVSAEANKRPINVNAEFSPTFSPTVHSHFDHAALEQLTRELVANREAAAAAMMPQVREVREFTITHDDGSKSTIRGS